jgi:hypothetical protein
MDKLSRTPSVTIVSLVIVSFLSDETRDAGRQKSSWSIYLKLAQLFVNKDRRRPHFLAIVRIFGLSPAAQSRRPCVVDCPSRFQR